MHSEHALANSRQVTNGMILSALVPLTTLTSMQMLSKITSYTSSKQYNAFKTHLTVMINLKEEVQQQVEIEWKTWSL
jgi:hypothetical protein